MIYLDNNAYTFLDPEVKEAIDSFIKEPFGNPSSPHALGRRAGGALVESTFSLAKYFNVRPEEIYFTSGATEGLNMLIKSIAKNGHIISSNLEHPAVLHVLKTLENPITYIQGLVTFEKVCEALRPDTKTLIFMAVNNETGIKTDIFSLAALAQQKEFNFIVDGVALLGKEPFTLPEGVTAACFSSHKIHGPTGVGLCIVKKGVKFTPLIYGGYQQRGKRGGTENVPAIVGFAKAVSLLQTKLPAATHHIKRLRDLFEKEILSHFPDTIIHGREQNRICNVSNLAIAGIDGETLLMRLDRQGIAASLGSACSSGGFEPSHVLLGLGVSPVIAASSLRFSLSRYTTEEEILRAVEIIISSVRNLQGAPCK